MKTIGQAVALYSFSMRRKFGRFPVPEGTLPLPGHENDEIPGLPNYAAMTETQRNNIPLNREDDRRRFRKLFPRAMRLDTFSRRLHKGLDRDA